MKVNIPPIKSQGIKTKLVPWIKSIIPHKFEGRWIEPFAGTGVVAFNLAPKHALLCDTNLYLINFYNSISNGDITPEIVRDFLNREGANLLDKGESHYIADGGINDIIYCDPPYIDRHVDYYNGWDDEHEKSLYQALSKTPSKFILSTWHHNNFRENEYIELLWNNFNILTKEHFYYIGGSEKNRNSMIEAIVINYDVSIDDFQEQKKQEQGILYSA